MKKIRIGTRSSALAVLQTEIVIKALLASNPNISKDEIEIIKIKTIGDKILDCSLSEIGGKSLFTKEIENELLEGNINMAVHSLKDFTSKLPDGLKIAAVLEREDPRDAIVSFKSITKISEIGNKYSVGTSSCRRNAQLLNLNKETITIPLRGNVISRIEKVKHNEMDLAILAVAGLKRLGIDKNIYHPIEIDEMLPAPGQGAICIETAENDEMLQVIASSINHQDSWDRITAERGFLEALDGDCNTPIAAIAEIIDDRIFLKCEVLTRDGSHRFTLEGTSTRSEAYNLGNDFGKKLKEKLV